MELFENSIILATLVAIFLYFVMQSKPPLQPVSSPVDADERRRRREHFALAAEARARQQGDADALKDGRVDCAGGEKKDMSNANVLQISRVGKVATLDASTERQADKSSDSILQSGKSISKPSTEMSASATKAVSADETKESADRTTNLEQGSNDESMKKQSVESKVESTPTTRTSHESIDVGQSSANITESKQNRAGGGNKGSTKSKAVEQSAITSNKPTDSTLSNPTDKGSTKSKAVEQSAITSDKPTDSTLSNPTDRGSTKSKADEQSAITSNKPTDSTLSNPTERIDEAPEELEGLITVYLLLTSSPATSKSSINISSSCTSTKLRELASKSTSVPLNELRLIYRGKVIFDSSKSIKEYGVEDGGVLHLVGRPKTDSVAVYNESDVNADVVASRSDIESIEEHQSDDPNQSNYNDIDSDSSYEQRLPIHDAAAIGDIATLRSAAIENLPSLYEQDINGWTPLHEAARGGHAEIIDFLISEAENNGLAPSAVVNTVSNFGTGWTPLALAIQHHGDGHVVTNMLRQLGGQVVYPRR